MTNTHLKFGEYEARIVVENTEVEHYGIESNGETKVAACWIASTTGKRFGLRIAKHHNRFDCIVNMYLDGSLVRSTALIDLEPRQLERVWSAENSFRSFFFGTLDLTDDELSLNTRSYEELGSIKVTIRRMTGFIRTGPRKDFGLGTELDSENGKIHETAKKAVTHRTSLGQMQMADRRCSGFTSACHETVATFLFRYRSLDMLKANGIVPRDPSPKGTEGILMSASSNSVSRKRKARVKEEEFEKDRSITVIDSEDEEYQRKEAELEAELRKVRRARLDHIQDKHTRKKVKHEPKPAFLPGEVIDLTI